MYFPVLFNFLLVLFTFFIVKLQYFLLLSLFLNYICEYRLPFTACEGFLTLHHFDTLWLRRGWDLSDWDFIIIIMKFCDYWGKRCLFYNSPCIVRLRSIFRGLGFEDWFQVGVQGTWLLKEGGTDVFFVFIYSGGGEVNDSGGAIAVDFLRHFELWIYISNSV